MTPEQRRAWRRRVFAESELTAAQKLILLALETFADYPEGTNARPGVAILAEMCSLKTRVVEAALHEGRRLDLIERTARANPKRGQAACYRLVSTRTDMHVETGSTRTDMRIESGFQPARNEFQPARNGVSTRTLMQPTNPSTPIQNTEGAREARSPTGPEQASSAPAPPEQSANSNVVPRRARCSRHGHITDDADVPPCFNCKREAEAMDKAERERQAAERQRRAAEYERIQRCPDCRGGHWLLDQDGTPVTPAVRCTHPKLTRTAS